MIKLCHTDTKQVRLYSPNIQFHQLVFFANNDFQIVEPIFKFIDDDGDYVTISNGDDFYLCKMLAKSLNWHKMKIFVEPKDKYIPTNNYHEEGFCQMEKVAEISKDGLSYPILFVKEIPLSFSSTSTLNTVQHIAKENNSEIKNDMAPEETTQLLSINQEQELAIKSNLDKEGSMVQHQELSVQHQEPSTEEVLLKIDVESDDQIQVLSNEKTSNITSINESFETNNDHGDESKHQEEQVKQNEETTSTSSIGDIIHINQQETNNEHEIIPNQIKSKNDTLSLHDETNTVEAPNLFSLNEISSKHLKSIFSRRFNYEKELQILLSMGFESTEELKDCLVKYKGDIIEVIDFFTGEN